MLPNIFYGLFIGAFILDILMKNYEKVHEKPLSARVPQEDLIPSEVSTENQNDQNDGVNPHKQSSLKIKQGDEDLKVNIEGEREEREPYNGEKIVIRIEYCSGSNYIKNYEDLRKQLLESYQNVEVYGSEYPLPFVKKILSK
jgi:hypothetical protein